MQQMTESPGKNQRQPGRVCRTADGAAKDGARIAAMNAAALTCARDDHGSLAITLSGDWLVGADLPAPDPVLDELRGSPGPSAVTFKTAELGEWDSGLITTLVAIRRGAKANGVDVDDTGLPEGARRLVALAFAVPEREGARRAEVKESFLERLGERGLAIAGSAAELFEFTGRVVLSFCRLVRRNATFLRSDLRLHIQEAGAEAFPIVSLITFLIGMIFAFVGIVQLEQFGAGIYTADLVAVAMVREMSPIMTAIIMAGRTGASYAAQIGTMKVNEEIDALTTLGIDPVDFLVMPRVIALILMMPLLTMYGSLMGILGGTVVGVSMIDVSLVQYLVQTVNSVDLPTLFGGLFKSVVFGSLVAMAGCQQGMACGGSAMAVGQATTNAVVNSIVLIVVGASVLTIIYINLGI
jgi:phospholipid/cholesterol/gamma-HCH transport system permease protein